MKRFSSILTLLVVLVAGAWLVMNHQNIIDRLVVANYKPSSQIQRITDSIGLTDDGKFHFYAAQPALNNRQDFNHNCRNHDKESIILGCYISPQNIFIFRVGDERLHGVEEVTSAHEMLHVVYDRMRDTEKNEVNKLLRQELPKITNENLQKRLKKYEKTEPGERYNELHSIIGTEFLNISSQLESHYSKYFKNRRIVAEMAAEYDQMFRQLEQQQNGLVAEIEQLAAEHNRRVDSYNALSQSLAEDIADFNQKARSGYFESESDFNAVRDQLTARQNQLERELASIRDIEKRYEDRRTRLNALGSEAESLNRSLDSRLEPVPSL